MEGDSGDDIWTITSLNLTMVGFELIRLSYFIGYASASPLSTIASGHCEGGRTWYWINISYESIVSVIAQQYFIHAHIWYNDCEGAA
jgi:hypothetical protein